MGKDKFFIEGGEFTGAEIFPAEREIRKFLTSGWRLSNPKLSSPYIS